MEQKQEIKSYIHIAIDTVSMTTRWSRLWTVLSCPWFILIYIWRGKAILK
jgi:hypothetical protein